MVMVSVGDGDRMVMVSVGDGDWWLACWLRALVELCCCHSSIVNVSLIPNVRATAGFFVVCLLSLSVWVVAVLQV